MEADDNLTNDWLIYIISTISAILILSSPKDIIFSVDSFQREKNDILYQSKSSTFLKLCNRLIVSIV